MPVHDWTKVDAGTFHSFHNAWITHLMGKLNGGVLPEGYYALSEQYSSGLIPDVLTLSLPEPNGARALLPGRAGSRWPMPLRRSAANWSRTPRPCIAHGAAR